MKRTAKDPARRRRIEAEIVGPAEDLQAEVIEGLQPSAPGPVVVGQGNAVARVADSIHELQRRNGEQPVRSVVFDENNPASDPGRLTQKRRGILGMVQNIDKQQNVETGVGKRERLAIEKLYRNRGVRTRLNINSLDPHIRTSPKDLSGKEAVAAPDVQHPRPGGNELQQPVAEDADTAPGEVLFVKPFERVHRRFIPSTLMKKLERMVWKPRAVSVTPGTTHRIVWL